WLELQVLVEEDCRVGTCSTLLAGVQLGRRVEIGQGSTLGAGSVALADTRVGRHCEWLLPGRIPRELPNYSFYDELMPDGARIL
ncbi:acetyltransferase, partial [Pseudomonas aeruginosa]